jgi:hypothetical protein
MNTFRIIQIELHSVSFLKVQQRRHSARLRVPKSHEPSNKTKTVNCFPSYEPKSLEFGFDALCRVSEAKDTEDWVLQRGYL